MDNWHIQKITESTGGGRPSRQLKLPLGELSLFDSIISTRNLFLAWDKFRRGKRSKLDVQIFERNLEANIFELQSKLISGVYAHSLYKPFVINDPKQRQIHKATVHDRLVHQAIFQVIEPIFEKNFIFDSYSCRKGKGTHAAVNRLRAMLRKASKNNTKSIYCLKLDVLKFFASIDHNILATLLKRRISCCQTAGLLDQIINGFRATSGKGIPLGNLTSQLFANIYLHELDWFVRQELGIRYYVRYCDDFIILDTNRQYLEQLIETIQNFLNTKLVLSVHPNKIYLRNWNQGVDFLGYVLKPRCTLVRTKTRMRMQGRVEYLNISSYKGVCKHANCYELEMLLDHLAWGNEGSNLI